MKKEEQQENRLFHVQMIMIAVLVIAVLYKAFG